MGSAQGKEEISCVIHKTAARVTKEKFKIRTQQSPIIRPDHSQPVLATPTLFHIKDYQTNTKFENNDTTHKVIPNNTSYEKNIQIPNIKINSRPTKLNIRLLKNKIGTQSHPVSRIGSPTSKGTLNIDDSLPSFNLKSNNNTPIFKESSHHDTQTFDSNFLPISKFGGDEGISPIPKKSMAKSFSALKALKSTSLPIYNSGEGKMSSPIKIFNTRLDSQGPVNSEAIKSIENPSLIFENLDLKKVSKRRESFRVNTICEVIKNRRGSLQLNYDRKQ
ncbi:unnamed protein product [Blepharisma stoltei]|uniref:Exophilin 5 n=1 Tax=Blepharisma stoltei TaxID=1481888 RepID=A0AAU9KBF1_9CILI|nr:unnamed protein product [Blepharisma stoltei]